MALVLMLTALPLSAFADDTPFLCIGGTDVTAGNAADIFGDGTVSFSFESNTLTLNGADISSVIMGTTKSEGKNIYCGIYYKGDRPLTINTVKNSSVTSGTVEADATVYVIYADGSVIVTGKVLSVGTRKCRQAVCLYSTADVSFKDASATFYATSATDEGVAVMGINSVSFDNSEIWLYGPRSGSESIFDFITSTTVRTSNLNIISGSYFLGFEDATESEPGYAYMITVKPEPEPEPEPVDPGGQDEYPSYEEAEEEIIKTDTDKKDVKGSAFLPLRLKAKAKDKHKIVLSWKNVKNADGYIIYGSRCGRKLVKLKEVKKSRLTYTVKKLPKGKYFKYVVAAYKNTPKNGAKVLAVSKTVHCATKGGKYGNPTGVKLKAKALTIKKGKSKSLKPTLLHKRKVKTHVAKFRYESSDKKVATVNKKGKITAKKKGTAYIYVITQNGLYKKIKITVK